MNPIPPLALSLLVASSGLSAQTTILPSIAATKNPAYWSFYMFYGTSSTAVKNEGRIQILYSQADVGSIVKTWQSIQVRRPQNVGNQNAATTGTMKLTLSGSQIAPTAASATYRNNHGTTTVVFNKSYSLPARNRGTTWPAPWETAAPFANTYIYIGQTGGSLVVENEWSGSTSQRIWTVEAHRPDRGARVTNFAACPRHSQGGRNNSIGYTFPTLGGSWYVRYGGLPSNVPSMRFSYQIIGIGGVGAREFGMTLPIPLSRLNVPSPGCSLAVTNTINLPLTYLPFTGGTPNRGWLLGVRVPIPNTQVLSGYTFYDQAVCVDTNATTKLPEIYMSWSNKWTIGSGKGAPMTSVYRAGANTNTAGFVRPYEGPTLRFN